MSRVCDVCGRGTQSGNSRSHSNIATRRKFSINLQTKKIDGQRKKVCSSCIKTASKPKLEVKGIRTAKKPATPRKKAKK